MTIEELSEFQSLLEQLSSMREEVKEHRIRVCQIQQEIQRMDAGEVVVSDSVTCGKKGKKPLKIVKITGFPKPYYHQRIALFHQRVQLLEKKEQALLKLIVKAEEEIESIKDSRMRRILTMRYLDGLSWVQVAHKMGGKATADSCRKQVERFWKEK